MTRTIQSVAMIGLGAIGAAYGSRLHKIVGNRLTVIANEERIERYSKTGIDVEGQTVHFHYITPEAEAVPVDLIIIAVKNAELQEAIHDMKHHVGPETIFLPLLNGISSEEEIAVVYPDNPILYSMCVGIDAIRSGHQVRFSSIGKICFGEKDKSISDNVKAVMELFDQAEIPYDVPEDIWRTLWWKFMFNVGINQTSAVLRAPYQVFQTVPAAHQWMEAAMYEVVALSEKAGVHLTEADIHSFRPILAKLAPEGKTSMLQDVDAGRKTEVEYFAGKVCELGRKYGVPTPINDQLLQIIPIIEAISDAELETLKEQVTV
ncbi:ketopantoate reductase family protein [Sporosarcina sp. 179-K 3D1 HS]|uniref:ketopantoate reductase family protein n=1 Tax=Sporosarcina sp. 179-K 3D1 HS TaxID=3232169 RepID=UPI0039A14068